MFFSSVKERNRLSSNGMSNIYLKVTIEKKWRTQIFNFVSLKGSSPALFLGEAPTHADIIEILNFLLQLTSQWSVSKSIWWLFYYFYFERNYDVLKSRRPCFLLNKNVNFSKNELQSKMGNATRKFRELNLALQLV